MNLRMTWLHFVGLRSVCGISVFCHEFITDIVLQVLHVVPCDDALCLTCGETYGDRTVILNLSSVLNMTKKLLSSGFHISSDSATVTLPYTATSIRTLQACFLVCQTALWLQMAASKERQSKEISAAKPFKIGVEFSTNCSCKDGPWV